MNPEMIAKILEVTNMVLIALGGLVVFATMAAKFTKTTKDDEIVGKVKEFWLKFIKFAPTVGINPQTKRLEEELAALKAKDENANP